MILISTRYFDTIKRIHELSALTNKPTASYPNRIPFPF